MSWARFAGLAGIVVVLVTSTAFAVTREVSGTELAQLLTGNSIKGQWGETHYIQYFAVSGRTLYKAEGSPGDWGTWRINDEGQYCSTWRNGEENCYLVVDIDGSYFWQSLDGQKTYPFELIEGEVAPSDATDGDAVGE